MARGYPDYRYFSFPVSVAEGGTGVGTLTLNGVLLGNATSQILATAAGAADAVLRVPAIGGAPAFGAVDLSKAAAVTGLLPVARGGSGTATPSLVAGANIGITGTWPAQTVAFSGLLPVASGGTGTATPALVQGTGITITGTWPAHTIALTTPVAIANGGTGTATGSITGTGALTFAAGGADQDVTLTPSGSGLVVVSTALKFIGVLSAFQSNLYPLIQGTSGAGAAYPFLEYGNLVIQPRSSGALRDIVLATGNPAVARWIADRAGHLLAGTDNAYDLGASGATRPRTGYFGTSLVAPRLISTVAIGTAPLAVTSTTQVTNLNAERVAGTQVTNSATLGLLLIGSGAATAAWATPDGARVYNFANITLTSGSPLALTFDSERYDNGGLHEGVTNPSRLTAQKAGKYFISAHVIWDANATGRRGLYVKLNGITWLASHVQPTTSASYTEMSVATVYHLAATDYVEAIVFQDSGGNLNALAVSDDSPVFAMQWLGP